MTTMPAHIEHLRISDDDLLRMTIMNKTVVSERGCWEWQGAKHSFGYGVMMRQRKRLSLHRLSHELWVGPIPKGMVVRHKCDNPCCVNPNHLIYGTQADNMADVAERGRHGAKKMTAEQVAEIRASAEPTSVLAERYGVGVMSINRARRGATWAHIKGGKRAVGNGRSASTGRSPSQKITAVEAEVIRSSSLSTWLLSSIFGITRKSVSNIKNGVTWKVQAQLTGGDFAG